MFLFSAALFKLSAKQDKDGSKVFIETESYYIAEKRIKSDKRPG